MNNKKMNKPILLTGSHRSGSTWVGRMIAVSPSIAYIHEPFNIKHPPGICGAEFDYWFTYVCKSNELQFYHHIKNTLNFKYQLLKEIKVRSGLRSYLGMLKEQYRFSKNRILNKRPLMKDPIAIFSADWLAKSFDMDVLVLIRHPAAFAGSLKKANWKHPFDHFLKQPLLMEHHLSEFETEIKEFVKNDKDIIEQAILLWNLVHYMILQYKEKHPEWIFVKHEDILANPISEFEMIFRKLNLEFTPKVKKTIEEFSITTNKDEQSLLKRNSKSNIWSWKERLTTDEINLIREKTYTIAKHFYSEDDWDN